MIRKMALAQASFYRLRSVKDTLSVYYADLMKSGFLLHFIRFDFSSNYNFSWATMTSSKQSKNCFYREH